MTVPLIGYLDRLSGRPGEAIAVKVSSELSGPFAADLVRIIHADPNPDGPGMKLEEVASSFAGTYPSRPQPVHPGSYAVIDAALAVPEAVRSDCGCSRACCARRSRCCRWAAWSYGWRPRAPEWTSAVSRPPRWPRPCWNDAGMN